MIRSDMELLQAVQSVRDLREEIIKINAVLIIGEVWTRLADDEQARAESVKRALIVELNSYLDEINEYLRTEENFFMFQSVQFTSDCTETEMLENQKFLNAIEDDVRIRAREASFILRQNPITLEFYRDEDIPIGVQERADGKINYYADCECDAGRACAGHEEPKFLESSQAPKCGCFQHRSNRLRELHGIIKPAVDNPAEYASAQNIDTLCMYVMELEMMVADLLEGK